MHAVHNAAVSFLRRADARLLLLAAVGLLAACGPSAPPPAPGAGQAPPPAQVGVVTSAMRSPLTGQNIALCRISVHSAAVGTKVEVGQLDGHQKRLPATVSAPIFYDPDKSRVRA